MLIQLIQQRATKTTTKTRADKKMKAYKKKRAQMLNFHVERLEREKKNEEETGNKSFGKKNFLVYMINK